MPNLRSRGRICLAWLISALLTAGCAQVGPDYLRPETNVSENWLEAGDQRLKTEGAAYRNWWQVFKDPILDQLVDTAYRENLNLRIAGVRVLEARAQLGIATGQLYPQTQQATGSVQKNRESAGVPIPGTAISAPRFGGLSYWQSQVGLTASWEIDFWGKFRRAIESADASMLAAVANYDSTLVSLTASVANFYISIRTLEKRLTIAQQNVETQRESLKIAQARFEGGTTSQRDVEQAKTVLASTQATIPVLQTQLRQAKDALCVLLGMPPSRVAAKIGGQAAVIPAPPPQVVVGIPAELLRRRPDIRAAEYAAAAQCAQIGVSRAELFPAFSLLGNFGLLSTDVGKNALGEMFNWRNRNGAIGPSVQWNILNYGQITNLVRVQDARFQAVAHHLSKHRAQRPAGRGGQSGGFLEDPGAGQVSGRKRQCRLELPESGRHPIPGRHHGFHHRPHGPAVSAERPGQSGQRPGQHLRQPGGSLPGPGRRLGNPGRPGFRPRRHQGSYGEAHQLGKLADAAQPAAAPAGGATKPDPGPGLVIRCPSRAWTKIYVPKRSLGTSKEVS